MEVYEDTEPRLAQVFYWLLWLSPSVVARAFNLSNRCATQGKCNFMVANQVNCNPLDFTIILDRFNLKNRSTKRITLLQIACGQSFFKPTHALLRCAVRE